MRAETIRRNMADNGPGPNRKSVPDEIELQCPRCSSEIARQECGHCGFQMRELSGILHALPPERIVHHARFVEEYERVQRAQFLESRSDEFFLGLPYSDASRRNVSYWARKAISFDFVLRRVLKVAVPPGGRILDLGAGNCWLSYRLALAGYKPCAIDLLTNDLNGLGAAEHYREFLPEFFHRLRAEFDSLPFKDGQFDAAIYFASFQYAESFEAAMREAWRCCRRRGVVIICDTPSCTNRETSRRSAGDCPTKGIPLASTSGVTAGILSDRVLSGLEKQLHVRWTSYLPHLGFRSFVEPMLARLRRQPQPPEYRIWVAQKP